MKRFPLYPIGRGVVTGLLLVAASSLVISEPLPQPLTLDHALSLSETLDPLLQQQEAARRIAEADRALAGSESGFDLRLHGRLRWVGPSRIAFDQGPDDHLISVVATKQLYDFGQSSARVQAAEADVRHSRMLYRQASQQRRIDIMARFFDVLLADAKFARDNEAMSIAYVSMDKLRNRHELGQVSDIEMARVESLYQQSRHRRAISETQQRASRSQLAIALSRPTDLPSELSRPALTELKRELPDYESLIEKGLANNALLRARREAVVAAERRIEAARAKRSPVIAGEVAATEYSRLKGGNDDWIAGIRVEVPLYLGGAIGASVAREQARLYEAQAQLQRSEQTLRQAILDEWLELSTLRVKLDQVTSLEEYRDLYLDRSRANYEMEVQTDLGDAMVKLSEAELERMESEFSIVLAWARLDALLGETVSAERSSQGDNR